MVVGSRRVVLDAPVAVYNLEVAGAHTYFVEDGLGRQTPLWVHNNCAGQLHHAISKRVFRELQDHPNLAGKYALRDSRFVTRAVSLEAHRGYQDWHRLLDDEVVAWLRRNQKATVRKFEKWLVWRYQQPDLRARFPDGL